MVDTNPDPCKSRKALCADVGLHKDSLRKYLCNPLGPPFGLVEKFMRITGCYKPLYWLAHRGGFVIIREDATKWDRRRKLMSAIELRRLWLNFETIMFDLENWKLQKTKNQLKARSSKAQKLIQALKEELTGCDLLLSKSEPQIELFTAEED